eukprot:CAMPEP_0172319786 /NCGR_PEP_ID=MMETSP1058-20130122/38700_1 /TAXON_ID=83371 /ORGANISM="Detonula confervacea, Strain CCMP 353" /LENGTH=214 /DNA_ID=CAMNT_0013034907 /DNA_START=228 /DNA_END=872 /DNA_ORIENTATION=-
MASTASSTAHKHRQDDDKNNDVIMLSGYPFYINGPNPSDVQAVFEKTQRILQDTCGDQLVSVERMGSSAIDGIAGTPVCDIVAELSPWPMNEQNKAKLEEAGYECQGSAPHTDKDEWFFGGDGEPGHLGRVVLHSVPKGSEFVQDMRAFCEYVNNHPEAFERYNNVKVQGAILMSKSEKEDGRLIGYKQKKDQVCKDIKQEAIKWWIETNGNSL